MTEKNKATSKEKNIVRTRHTNSQNTNQIRITNDDTHIKVRALRTKISGTNVDGIKLATSACRLHC